MEAAGRLAGLTLPTQGVLWPAQGSVPHRGWFPAPQAGSIVEGSLGVWAQRGGDESTDRKRRGLQAWPES